MRLLKKKSDLCVVFGGAGSSLWGGLFSSYSERELLSSCGTGAPRGSGSSC